jgi:uncharacterized Zn finger protein (UPF0148 family)
MNTFTESIIETFHLISCYTCGVRFGINKDLYNRVVTKAEGTVWCPACGKETCWRESEASKRIKDLEQKLKWEMENAQRQAASRRIAEASLIATKGVVTKLQKRASNGVCPCCNRTFKQLAAHMKTKHPEFKSASPS